MHCIKLKAILLLNVPKIKMTDVHDTDIIINIFQALAAYAIILYLIFIYLYLSMTVCNYLEFSPNSI